MNKQSVRILMETGDGRSASAILENGFLQYCSDRGAEVTVLSPGACHEPFVQSYQIPGARFIYLSVDKAVKVRHPRLNHYELRAGRLLTRLGLKKLRGKLWKSVGEKIVAKDAYFLKHLLDDSKPDCFMTVHVNQGFSRGLAALCHQYDIPTVGNIFSWDHPYYPQLTKPQKFTCWSQVVKDDLIRIKGYSPEDIEVIGAPVFDTYFDPESKWDRQTFCDKMNLDPDRPILLFATLGQMKMFWDETGTFKAFLNAIDNSDLPGPPQVILRLHPISIDHYFDDFRTRKDVVFSRYLRYCPNMRWWPSKEEMVLAANMLRHSDVCISPGSTMTVEAAIFDTPAIVPVFNPFIPDEYEAFFKKNWLNKHFSFLVQKDTVGLAKTPEDLVGQIKYALDNPEWLQAGRKKICENLLGPLDGKATERLADYVVNTAVNHRMKNHGR